MTIRLFSRPFVALLVAAAVAGCDGGEPPADGPADAPVSEEEAATDGAPDPGAPEPETDAPGAGVPDGGLEQWAADLRRGLEEVELAPRTSHDRVLELYTTRQEYIEMYYGPGGRITGDDHPELAEAVEEQEARFHELMELTGSDQRIQRERILGGVQELRLALNRTLELARERGVPLNPPDEPEGPESEDEGAGG